jgi:NAD(P)-dependent dehydrogenase (short-subunit alcohol dehydrogenase family)
MSRSSNNELRKDEMHMNKKLIIGGAAAALAGVTLYKLFTPADDIYEGPGGAWTAADMPDLSGKVIVVTGGNSGIGFEAAKEFARKGAHVVLACRNREKARSAMEDIVAEIPGASIEIMDLDLASLDSVRQFAADFKANHDRLDILVNNAGIMMVPYSETEDGFESQFGINHLGHFALTGLLLEPLLAAPGARVVTISSNAHQRGRMDFNDLGFQNGDSYDRSAAYNRSKLANLLFTEELQRRFEESGADITAVAAHPGVSKTHLADHLFEGPFIDLALPLADKIFQSAAMGALPTLRAAVDPFARGGDYYGPEGFNSFRGYPIKIAPSSAAQDTADAQRLWNVSERLTGVTYEALEQDKAGDDDIVV